MDVMSSHTFYEKYNIQSFTTLDRIRKKISLMLEHILVIQYLFFKILLLEMFMLLRLQKQTMLLC